MDSNQRHNGFQAVCSTDFLAKAPYSGLSYFLVYNYIEINF